MMGLTSGHAATVLAVTITAAAVLFVGVGSRVEAAPRCFDVTRAIRPCFAYLTDRAWAPPSRCCDGAAMVVRMAEGSDEDVQAVCECLRELATDFVGMDPNRAKRLSRECALDMNLPISPTVDCSDFQFKLKD